MTFPVTAPDRPSALPRLLAALSDDLTALAQAGLRRQCTTIDAFDGVVARVGGREIVCWCSNDYLGLAAHPRVIEAAAGAAAAFGVGGRASRLLGGTTAWHARLEEALATFFGAEAAVVFASGYLANLGALTALLGAQDAVFLDRLAHASLIDAVRMSRARLRVFPHQDVDRLGRLLASAAGARRRVVVTEGVFSMDGDVTPVDRLAEVARRYDALVYLDDAHGAFVLGPTGRGTPEAHGMPHDGFLYMGTLGKALGAQGGFLIGPRTLIDALHHRARPFIYATALAVPVAAAATTALQVIQDEPQWRQALQERVARLRQLLRPLRALPHVTIPEATHIVPIIVGDTARAIRLAERLWAQGHWAPPIRPPTVPARTARLRLSLSACHTTAQLEELTAVLQASLAS